jgi:hypothetical protein
VIARAADVAAGILKPSAPSRSSLRNTRLAFCFAGRARRKLVTKSLVLSALQRRLTDELFVRSMAHIHEIEAVTDEVKQTQSF